MFGKKMENVQRKPTVVGPWVAHLTYDWPESCQTHG
jgi:hypothetical protein